MVALREAIEAADAEHRKLLDSTKQDYAHLCRMHRAAAKVWALRSTLCFEQKQHDAARKASATANEHSSLAHKLEQTNAVDRLAELERLLSLSRQDAQRLARLE